MNVQLFGIQENGKDRAIEKSGLNFFVQHRKLGYNMILISQNDRQIDRQIRSLFEYEIKHRKVNNFKIGKLIPVSAFASITYWYGVNEKNLHRILYI